MSGQDPWKHRNAGMSCQTCMWFVEKVKPEGYGGEVTGKVMGRCRRHAPPVVFSGDWCGDHKLEGYLL